VFDAFYNNKSIQKLAEESQMSAWKIKKIAKRFKVCLKKKNIENRRNLNK